MTISSFRIYGLLNSKVEPVRNPTLFEMDKSEQAGQLVNLLNAERPYSEPGLLLGTSAFTANGWAGAFYPPGMKPYDSLSYYGDPIQDRRNRQYVLRHTERVYGHQPDERTLLTVELWSAKTPSDFKINKIR